MPTTACCSPFLDQTITRPLRTAWLPTALEAATLANCMAIDHTSRPKEMISTMTGHGLDLATTDLAHLTDEVLRMTPAGHKPDQRKGSSTFEAAPEVQTDDVKAATRGETNTTPRNPVQNMTTAAPLRLPEGEDTMTETLPAHLETIVAEVEAGTAAHPMTDHQAEARRARRS
ncbi:hypothetical protein H2200_006922 [Cladophialophora chaetospira]|uniref:Uncharacterized protein n=1 Tax=Cladophialophora chaetospira TaxID=386627 RepID=A0AA39CI49_9EURO|nr:hypothetical protein H2200_006922 [Cladophialophora chaetospira]